MSEERQTEILDEEIADNGIEVQTEESVEQIEEGEIVNEEDLREEAREEIFENLKNAFIEERHLLGRFLEFSEEHAESEFDEMGASLEESEEILRRANKIRDKLLTKVEQKLLYIFENVETNTLLNMIVFNLDAKENQFKVIVEVLEDGFNLEVL